MKLIPLITLTFLSLLVSLSYAEETPSKIDLSHATTLQEFTQAYQQQTNRSCDVVVVSGEWIRGKELSQILKIVECKYLVLDCVTVSRADKQKWQFEHPDVTFVFSQNKAIQKLKTLAAPVQQLMTYYQLTIDEKHLARIVGKEHLQHVAEFGDDGIPDIELGPFKPYSVEQLKPVRHLWTMKKFTLCNSSPSSELLNLLSACPELSQLDWEYDTPCDSDQVLPLEKFKQLVTLTIKLKPGTTAPLSGLQRLEELHISGKSLRNKDMKFLQNLKTLKKLTIGKCNLTGAAFGHLPTDSELEELSIYSCNVSTLQEVSRLQRLKEFELGSPIAGAEVPHLMSLLELERLRLVIDKLDKSSAHFVSHLKSLKDLSLYSENSEKSFLTSLEGLENVKSFSVSRMELGINELEHLVKVLPHVRNIHVSKIEPEAIPILSEFKSLETLILSTHEQDRIDNSITVQTIRQKYPHLQVVF